MVLEVIPGPFFIYSTFSLSVFLLIYIAITRKVQRNLPLVVLVSIVLIRSAAFVLAGWFVEIDSRLFWHKAAQTCLLFIPFLWLVLILRLTGRLHWSAWSRFSFLAIFPLLMAFLLWTNESHQLFWVAFEIIPGQRAFTAWLGPVGIASLIYNTGLTVAAIVVLVKQMNAAQGYKTAEYLLLIFCTATPLVSRVTMILAEITNTSWLPLPAGAGFFGAVATFIFSMFYYRAFGLVSLSAESVIMGMRDGILIIDQNRRVIEANPAAEKILGIPIKQMQDKIAEDLFINLKTRVAQEIKLSGAMNMEVFIAENEGVRFFDLRQSEISNPKNQTTGWLIALREITKRVKAEQEARKTQEEIRLSEEKFRSLVENINEIIYAVSVEGIVTYISPSIETILGYPAEEMIGKSYLDFLSTEDREHVESRFATVIAAPRGSLEFRILSNKGVVRHVRAFPKAIQQNGEIVGFQGVITDITEQKQVEEALERRASQLAVLNFIGERISAVFELDGLINSAVQLIQKQFGYYHVGIFTPEPRWNMLVMRANAGALSDLFPENHQLMVGQGMVGWAAENKDKLLANDVRLEPRYINLYPDKILTLAELVVPILAGDTLMGVLDIQSPMTNAFDENDVRVIETVADQIAVAMEKAQLYEEVRLQLKDRERRENMLRIQRDLLLELSPAKSLQETMQIALQVFSSELMVEQVSITLLDTNENDAPAVVEAGYPIHPGLHYTNADSSIPGWVIKNRQPVNIKNINPSLHQFKVLPHTRSILSVPLFTSGKISGAITLESNSAKAFSQDDEVLLSALANSLVVLIERARLFEEVTTARTELEKRASELERANKSLREMDRLKTEFLANISHELRTPLNSIIGFSEVLVDELLGKLNEEQIESINDIRSSGKQLLELINDLLDMSKINAGHMRFEPSTFVISELFDELNRSMQPIVQKKKQSLQFHLQDSSARLHADRLRIRQVLTNLLSNATKFTGEGGWISVSCQSMKDTEILFAVSDSGIGIHPEDQEIIFEEFRQVDGSMTREVSGTGLGLAISRRIIESHQGSIRVESEPGKGSTFYVHLPCRLPGDGE